MTDLHFTAGEALAAGHYVRIGCDGRLYRHRFSEADEARGFTVFATALGETVRMPVDPLAMRNLLDGVMILEGKQ